LSFEQLAIDASGNKLNQLAFLQGYGTFHLWPEHHDAYNVKVGQATLTPNGKSEFRADLEAGRVRVEVFSGSVDLATSERTAKLGKGKVEEFDPGSTQLALNQKEGIVKDSWDKWTAGRDMQTQLSMNDQAVSSPGQLYGWGDLDAYGEWGFFPGFGYGWSPYVATGWSPYTMGMWNFYPSMGYTWIASEPWGWLPYHYGSWGFTPGFGWFWMPGSFNNFSPAMVNWYSGPGWIGWAPLGGVGVVNTIPTNVVQNGLLVTPGAVNRVPVNQATLLKSVPFQPGAGALLGGVPLGSNPQTVFTSATPRTLANHTAAPASLLMGGNALQEQTLRAMGSAHEPLRARMGTTLGGQYTIHGSIGEFRGDPFGGRSIGAESWHGEGAGGAMMLAHGQHAAFNSQAAPGASPPPPGTGNYGGHGVPVSTSAAAPAPSQHSSGPAPSSSGGGTHH
jgi:hypothetical protein